MYTNTQISILLSYLHIPANLNCNLERNIQDMQYSKENQTCNIHLVLSHPAISYKFQQIDDIEEEENLMNQLCVHFPTVSEQLSQLTHKQRKSFIIDMLVIYQKLSSFETMIITRNYARQLDLQQNIVTVLPHFKTNLSIINNQQIMELFEPLIKELRNYPLIIDYIYSNPHELATNTFLLAFVSPLTQNLLQLINIQKTRFELRLGLRNAGKATPAKRSFQEMKATNSIKVLAKDELQQIKNEKNLSKRQISEYGELFEKEVSVRSSKQKKQIK